MARARGLLCWVGDAESSALVEGFAGERALRIERLGPGGEIRPDLGPFDQVVVVADWTSIRSVPEAPERWRAALPDVATAVLVLADRQDLDAILRPEALDGLDDVIVRPVDGRYLAHRVRALHRMLGERHESQGLGWEMARQAFDFREFNRVALALSAERDVNRLLDLILSKCRELTTADAGSLYLVEEKELEAGRWDAQGERTLRFVVAQNDSKSLDLKSASLPLNRASIAGYVALTQTPLNLRDVYHLPPEVEFSFNARMDLALGYRTVSMLVIPLVDHTSTVIGVVQVINKKRSPEVMLATAEVAEVEARPFGPRDEEMVTSLASLAAVALNKALLITRIERLLEGIVRASVTAIEQRDPATAGHSDRVARLTVGLARVVDRATTGEYGHVRFTRDELKELEYASLLHDIGKVGVREHVLLKAKKLFDWELTVVQTRFDFIRRTTQYEYARRMAEVLMRLGPDAARPHVKQLEEELARRLQELDGQVALVHQVNEPTVLRNEVKADLHALAGQRYLYVDDSERPYLTEHEIGCLAIPVGSLNEAERQEIQSHVTYSYRFLMQIPWTKELRRVPLIAYSHHERLDGSGYPRNVGEAEVPIQARMMAISDVYDALTAADRPYKRAVSTERALDILRYEAKGGRLDQLLLDLFVEAEVFVPPRPTTRAGRG